MLGSASQRYAALGASKIDRGLPPIDLTTLLLFLSLGAPSFTTREASSTHLQSLPACHVYPYLDAFARHPDPEVRRRVHVLRAQHADALADCVLGPEPAPWLDALPRDYPNRWEAIHTYLNVPGADRHRVGDHPGYRAATALWLRDRIADGLPLDEAADLLGRMRARCPLWQGGRWVDE